MKRKLREPIKFGLQLWEITALAFGGIAVSCSNNWAELGVSILIGMTSLLPMMIMRIEE